MAKDKVKELSPEDRVQVEEILKMTSSTLVSTMKAIGAEKFMDIRITDGDTGDKYLLTIKKVEEDDKG